MDLLDLNHSPARNKKTTAALSIDYPVPSPGLEDGNPSILLSMRKHTVHILFTRRVVFLQGKESVWSRRNPKFPQGLNFKIMIETIALLTIAT